MFMQSVSLVLLLSLSLNTVNSRAIGPYFRGPYFPYYLPPYPGGRAVNYLSHETEAFGDDLSSRITDHSRDVAAIGDYIQHTTDAQSQVVEDIGREVDSDESIPFPANQVEEDLPDEDEQEDNGTPEWPSEER